MPDGQQIKWLRNVPALSVLTKMVSREKGLGPSAAYTFLKMIASMIRKSHGQLDPEIAQEAENITREVLEKGWKQNLETIHLAAGVRASLLLKQDAWKGQVPECDRQSTCAAINLISVGVEREQIPTDYLVKATQGFCSCGLDCIFNREKTVLTEYDLFQQENVPFNA